MNVAKEPQMTVTKEPPVTVERSHEQTLQGSLFNQAGLEASRMWRHWVGPACRLAFPLPSPAHSSFRNESSQLGILAVVRVGPRFPLLKASEHLAGLRCIRTIMGKLMEPIFSG